MAVILQHTFARGRHARSQPSNDAPTSNPRRFQELRCLLRLHRHLHVSFLSHRNPRTRTRGWCLRRDRYPGRVPKGAACEVALLRAARAASPRTSFIISISSPPRASAAALALPLSRADAHLVAVHAAAAAAAAAAAPTDDACGNVHARPRHCTRCVRRHGARHSLFRSPLPLARTRRRSLACSLSRAPRKSDVSPLACARRHLARRRFDLPPPSPPRARARSPARSQPPRPRT